METRRYILASGFVMLVLLVAAFVLGVSVGALSCEVTGAEMPLLVATRTAVHRIVYPEQHKAAAAIVDKGLEVGQSAARAAMQVAISSLMSWTIR